MAGETITCMIGSSRTGRAEVRGTNNLRERAKSLGIRAVSTPDSGRGFMVSTNRRTSRFAGFLIGRKVIQPPRGRDPFGAARLRIGGPMLLAQSWRFGGNEVL